MMNEKVMKNSYITNILKAMSDEVGQGIFKKQLPTRLLYALRRSLPEVETAYKAYSEALTDICTRYGVTPQNPMPDDIEQQKEISKELTELLNTETVVRVYTITPEILDRCGEGTYDSLTYEEIDRLWWLFDDE